MKTVTVPAIVMGPDVRVCTNPLDALTIGTLNEGADDHGFVAAVAVTVGTDDRLNTVERVTGIVPPDDATMTKGALESVTVPELSDVALLRVIVPDVIVVAVLTTVQLLLGETMPLLSDLIRYPDDAVSTVGLPLICTSPLDALRTTRVPDVSTSTGPLESVLTCVLGLVTVTAVDGLVTVTAVVGTFWFDRATRTPPELVTVPYAVVRASPRAMT